MQIPIKSQDGISTYFIEGQLMSFDEATQSLVLTAFLKQADTKEFVNPEPIVLTVPLPPECTSMVVSAISEAYNTPKEEIIEDVKV